MDRIYKTGGTARRVVCLFLALVMACGMIVTNAGTARADTDKIGVTPEDGWVNLRLGPGTGSIALTSLAPGTIVTIIGEAADTNQVIWYKVETENEFGYVRHDLITVMTAIYEARSATTVSDDTLNVRSAPGSDQTSVGSLAPGTTISVVGEAKAADGSLWYRIVYGNGHGFVHSGYVTLSAVPTPTPTPTPTPEPTPMPTPEATPTPGVSEDPNVSPTPGVSEDPNVSPTPEVSEDPNVSPTPEVSASPEVTPTPTPTPTPDPKAEFIAYLTEQGFPESYHEDLIELHEKYPNWIFKAHLTGLDWNVSVDAEAEIPRSLVEYYWPSSWKMASDAAYDWETNTWYTFDGTDDHPWQAASREIIAYYMDPRNFLNSTNLFQFLDQSYDPDVQTVEGVEQIIAGSFMEEDVIDTDGTVLNYAAAIYNAGVTYQVNPYVLAAMILIEQGSEGSSLCSGTVPGYYGYFNYYNIGAYKSGNLSPVTMGLIYAKGGTDGTGTSNGRPWNTRLKAINGGAIFYANSYMARGQSTFYLKRFNVVGDPPYIWQYSTAVYGAKIEGDAFAKGYNEELRTAALTFYIPVYENMPETAAERPEGDGSPNMKLSSLSVSGYELTPHFDDDTLEYSLVVPAHVQKLTINAKTMDSKATVAGAGTVSLTETLNTIAVTVTAENGMERTYTITIAKEDAGISGAVEFNGKYLPVELCIPFAPGTLTSDFISQAMVSGTVTVTTADGSPKEESALLGTGDIVRVYDDEGNEYGIYTVAMIGDANADNNLTINDIIKIRNHLLGSDPLTGANLAVSDTNRDGKYTINDIIVLRNHILGTAAIG